MPDLDRASEFEIDSARGKSTRHASIEKRPRVCVTTQVRVHVRQAQRTLRISAMLRRAQLRERAHSHAERARVERAVGKAGEIQMTKRLVPDCGVVVEVPVTGAA